MQLADISIIIPVRNIEQEIAGILRSVAVQVHELEAEFIVVDMGSHDRTVLEAVQLIKEMKLKGFVIQNGDSTVSTALNTGIQKAGGEYITFILARRLYRDFIRGYYETAMRTSADFIFGCVTEEEVRAAERRLISKAVKRESGGEYIKNILKGNYRVDISAILIRRKFLLEKKIRFYDSCSYGYAEEFVFRCLFMADSIVQSPVIIKRDAIYELKRPKQKPVGRSIFQRADAVLRIIDMIKTNSGDDELLRLFEYEKLPLAIMDAVDILLKEGMAYNAVRGYLKAMGYEKMLQTGRVTDKALKRRIAVWQFIPWMYKPKSK